MIRKLFLGSAVAAVAAIALLLTVGSLGGKDKPAEAVVASISTTTTTIDNDFWAQLHIVAEDNIFATPGLSPFDIRVTATAGDFGGLDLIPCVAAWPQNGCAPVLIPTLPACYYDEFLATPCIILESDGFPWLGVLPLPTIVGPADRDVWICNTGEHLFPILGFNICEFDVTANTTEVEIWWRSPGGFPGGTVTFSAWQGASVKAASITVLGAPASIELVAMREFSSSESSGCEGTPVYVIAAVEYSFNNFTTFDNNRARLCAEVRDSNNSLLSGVAVNWSVVGGGSLSDGPVTFSGPLAYNSLTSGLTGNSGDIATVTASTGSASDSVMVEFGGDPASCTMTIAPDPLDIGDTAEVVVTFVDEFGNKVPDGIIVDFIEVDSGDGADNVQLISTVDDTTDSMAGTSIIGAISGLTTIAANIESIALTGDAFCSEAIELSGDIHQTPGVCDDEDFILYGFPPPGGAGEFGTFAFCGGTYEQLLDASGCPEATAVFFYNKPDGGWATWIPGSDVAAVNAEIFSIFPMEHTPIPEGTIFTAKCK